MANRHEFNRQIRRTAIITAGLAACLVFGIVVLASGDWLPGGIIVIASTVGLARTIPLIRKLCNTGYPASAPKRDAVK